MQRNNVKMGWVLHVKRQGFGNDKVSVLKIIHIPIFGVNFVFNYVLYVHQSSFQWDIVFQVFHHTVQKFVLLTVPVHLGGEVPPHLFS